MMSDADTIIELGDQLAAMCESLDDLKQQLTAEREARQRAEEDIEGLLADTQKLANALYREQQRAEAAEARIKASQEQKPVYEVVTFGTPVIWSEVSKIVFDGYDDFNRRIRYKQPPIPPEVVELQRENAELTRKLAEQQAKFDTVRSLFIGGENLSPRERMAFDSLRGDTYRELTKLIEEAKRQAVPEGWKLVPIEPTNSMIEAALISGFEGEEVHVIKDYKAMLSAAPQSERKD